MDSMISTNYKNKNLSSAKFYPEAEDSGWSLYSEQSLACTDIMESAAVSSGSEFSDVSSATSTKSASKRRKTHGTFTDHDLEDTATSPVSSSKVDAFDELYTKLRQGRASYDLDMLKSIASPVQKSKLTNENLSEIGFFDQADEVRQSGFIGKDINFKGLTERGLCLVPVSMLFNF